jgi:hypothetical protein
LESQGTRLRPGPLLALKAERELRIGSRLPSIGCLRLGRALESRAEVEGVLGLGLIPWPEVAHERT